MNNKDKIHYIDWSKLKDFATEALSKAGVFHEDAAIIADTLVEADLRGVDTHGVALLAQQVRMISEGNMNPRPNLSIIKETPMTAVIDADNGVGNLICGKATEIAIKKAENSGVGIVAAKNGTLCGALAYYPMMALKHDMMGFITINGPPLVPAYGGITKLLSTNPYAAAIPAGDELPVVIDMASTTVARHKLKLKAESGEKAPSGWALNRYGEPTDDPEEALGHGFPAWLGGYKGYALAVLANILSGVLSGSAFGPQNYPPYNIKAEPGSQLVRTGHFIVVLSISNFMPIGEFKSRMDAMIRETKASELAKGFNRIYLPGEPEFEEKDKRLKTGIPLRQTVWEDLLKMQEKLGLSSSLE